LIGGKIGQFLAGIFLNRAAKQLTVQTWMQGMGRHSIEDVRTMMKQDFQHVSDFLGKRRYMMGDKVF
jgi:hypothetical protein